MTKKIVLGVLAAGLVALLVIGGVNRTLAKAGEGQGAGAGGYGRGRAETTRADGALPLEAAAPALREGVGGGWGRGVEADEATGAGGGWGRNGGFGQTGEARGAGGAAGAGLSLGQTEDIEWTPVSGTVESVSEAEMVVRSDDGTAVTVQGRPWAYALEQGLTVQAGDRVTVTGYDRDGEFVVNRITVERTGATVMLRDEAGRPGWAGRGRGRW